MRYANVEIYVDAEGTNVANVFVCKPAYGKPSKLPPNYVQTCTCRRDWISVEVAIYNRKISREDIQRIVRVAIDGKGEVR